MANTYTVKPGDTLGKIASSLGTSVRALAEVNNIHDVDAIRVGQVLDVPGAGGLSPPAPPPSPPRASSHELGKLSERFESGGRGPGTVSGGVGDAGGVSYGSYQLASKRGRPEEFLATEGARWAAEFGGAKSGTPAFSATWKAIAAREGPAFHAAQHAYIKRTHYDAQCSRVRTKTGVDLDSRCDAIRDAVWSTAVQQGPDTDAIVKAMAGGSGDDRKLLTAIYAERGRRKADGSMAYFGKCSPAVQKSVANRYREELDQALKMLDAG
jgi:murein DD-endopeptidase MepM/ murein hydrolase activator NlpD